MSKVALVHAVSPEIYTEIAMYSPKGLTTINTDLKKIHDNNFAHIKDAEFIMLCGNVIPDEIINVPNNIRLIQLMSAGWDFLNIPLIKSLNIPVANNGGANSWAVADHTIMLILATYHRLIEVDKATRDGEWGYPLDGTNVFELAGKRVGLLGMGNIARQVARRLLPFDARIQYHDLHRLSPNDEEDLSIKYVDMETLFSSSDIISIHIPLIDSTYHLIDKNLIDLMKPSAIIVNTSRGSIIKESYLIKALSRNKISGAALDVFEQEPIEKNNPLLSMKNVIVTPHCAGNNWDAWSRRAKFGYSNIQNMVNGGEPLSIVHL
ncbi:MAG: lactate dehydrogenase [Dehalococcoidia bacterium]|nr:lactate dehydrogenase [Dehalococcoidia bacterium]MQG15478.1 lactate dehydrogenase [SAR202 cluster bacterium]|tara:strand:+ start:30053 stop:31015 length:963 start_codon:yes stop_codon:yes gene_type:complete